MRVFQNIIELQIFCRLRYATYAFHSLKNIELNILMDMYLYKN